MEPMDSKLRKVVKKFSYPIWFIIRDEDIDCPCMDFTTKQADPNCDKCLGLGKKIRVLRANAAHQVEDISQRGEGMGFSEKAVNSQYYSLNPVDAFPGDIIVDNMDVDVIQRTYAERTNHTDAVYYRFDTTPKKTGVKAFLKNFDRLLEKHGHGRV